MTHPLINIIASPDDSIRHQRLDTFCATATRADLLDATEQLDRFRRQCDNLYQRVRALFFLYAIHRYFLPSHCTSNHHLIPIDAMQLMFDRRFTETIDCLQSTWRRVGPSDAISSALAEAYRRLGFQTLADQVRRSVRSTAGNQWMFRAGHPGGHPLRIRPELLLRHTRLIERTPVRMDLSHSGWSDIFFLGMDYPEGARVVNVSVDLAVRGRDTAPKPPIETTLRIINKPVLRLASVDLHAAVEIKSVNEVFDFARDYLGLLKAAVIASGIIPPGLEGTSYDMRDVLAWLLGVHDYGTDAGAAPARGLEVVSHVNDIPRGSRLAVSTNLLASLISLCMRATGQIDTLEGPLTNADRRTVAARAILGEWLGGSGGGWQDSGGLWPGIKLIEGCEAAAGNPEYGVSRGRLLPNHTILDESVVSPGAREKLQSSLILVHGGMAQDVGPILELVTEKYLLRLPDEWQARQDAARTFDHIVDALKSGDIRALGTHTTDNFQHPLSTIIPWVTNEFTERLISNVRERFGARFWGFWMLGGMSGGGMGFIFDPAIQPIAKDFMQEMMMEVKQDLQDALPFAMNPVVYDFSINECGTSATLDTTATAPQRSQPHASTTAVASPHISKAMSLQDLLDEWGFDRQQHEQIRSDLQAGRLGLSQNRLSANTLIEDARPDDVIDVRPGSSDISTKEWCERGLELLRQQTVAVVTMAGGIGSRWTAGAGVVKALDPFVRLGGRFRSFIDIHLAKSRRIGRLAGILPLPHVFTSGFLTYEPMRRAVDALHAEYPDHTIVLSKDKPVGLRLIPMERDLRFAWEETRQQILDERQQKVRESLNAALIGWAKSHGEGSDYTDNLPLQCLHPTGHWYPVPNMLINGVLASLMKQYSNLRYLMLHNIDTVGADADPALLAVHAQSGSCLTYEVITRRIEDRGGGLARINGAVRMVEGLALPTDDDEYKLSYYNSATVWIDINQLLAAFGISRHDMLSGSPGVREAVRAFAQQMPTYVTLKDVKKRWGQGQEDIFPVCQFEKLWTDMSCLSDVTCSYALVSRFRGQQLKDHAQLDPWLRDGSAAYVDSICEWKE